MIKRYLIFALILTAANPGFANDWGYEGLPKRQDSAAEPGDQQAPQAMRAEALALPKAVIASPKAAQPAAVKSAPGAAAGTKVAATVPVANVVAPAPKEPQAQVDQKKQAALLWLKLFQGLSKQHLSVSESKRIETFLCEKAALGGKASQEVLAILKFWPRVSDATSEKPELENAYADLFKALLRMRERQVEKLTLPTSDIQSDSDLITQILGMERLAVAGDPPFAEEAVNAYADMACFVYEQKHPGKTVDASDNRALFARVVADKFKAAPGDAERRAMARFDLSWAKFRIVWQGASEATRKELLDKLSRTGADSVLTAKRDPVLELVLSNWPWQSRP